MTKVEQIICESLTHRGYAIGEALNFLRIVKGDEVDETPHDPDRDYDALKKGFDKLAETNKELQSRVARIKQTNQELQTKLDRARKRLKDIRGIVLNEEGKKKKHKWI